MAGLISTFAAIYRRHIRRIAAGILVTTGAKVELDVPEYPRNIKLDVPEYPRNQFVDVSEYPRQIRLDVRKVIA